MEGGSYMKKSLKKDGYVTVYLSLSLLVMLSLIFTLIEGIRMQTIRFQTECVMDMGLSSIFAEYHRKLWEQYDLLAMDTTYGYEQADEERTASHLRQYMNMNFTASGSNRIPGYKDLTAVHADNVALSDISYLSDEKGSINKEKLDGFVSIYKTVLQSIVDEDSRQREFLTSIVSGKEKSPKGQKILYLNPNDEARESILQTLLDPEADFLTTFFNGIGNDTLRKDYAKDILSECKQTDDMMQGQALSRTLQLIDIFGFEQSNLGQKIKFVEQLAELETNYSGDNIVDDFIQEVKNENGEIDFKFANNLLRLIKNTPVYLPERLVSHRSAILKDFTALEPEKSDKIAQSIIKLSSIYDVDDENTNFEEFFNYAFNPVTDKFDAEAFGLLMQAVGSVKIKFEDFEINNDIDLARLAQSEIDTVQSYFELVKDPKTGGIIPNSISPRKYILQN